MFRVDKTVVVSVSPHSRTSVEPILLSLIENYLNFRPFNGGGGLSHLDKTELKPIKPNTRRFYIKAAYTQRDK